MKSTKQSRLSISKNQIEPLRKLLDDWRKTRRPRSRIPNHIWDSAVRVAMRYGLNKTAKALNLDYYNLKKRLPVSDKEPAPSFIELSPAVSGSYPECSIELEARNGAKMRIHIKGIAVPDLNALSREFLRIKR